jgi:hypothetical protein
MALAGLPARDKGKAVGYLGKPTGRRRVRAVPHQNQGQGKRMGQAVGPDGGALEHS